MNKNIIIFDKSLVTDILYNIFLSICNLYVPKRIQNITFCMSPTNNTRKSVHTLSGQEEWKIADTHFKRAFNVISNLYFQLY